MVPQEDEALDVKALAVSADGEYLIALTDLPTYRLHLWRASDGQLLTSTSDNEPADHVAFNPASSSQLVTWSHTEGLQFWTIVSGYRKISLKAGSVLVESC